MNAWGELPDGSVELAELVEAWQEAYAAHRRATAAEQADPTNRAAVLAVVRAWQSLGEVWRVLSVLHTGPRWLVQATRLAELVAQREAGAWDLRLTVLATQPGSLREWTLPAWARRRTHLLADLPAGPDGPYEVPEEVVPAGLVTWWESAAAEWRRTLDTERAEPAEPEHARAAATASARMAQVWHELSELDQLPIWVRGALRLAETSATQEAHRWTRQAVLVPARGWLWRLLCTRAKEVIARNRHES